MNTSFATDVEENTVKAAVENLFKGSDEQSRNDPKTEHSGTSKLRPPTPPLGGEGGITPAVTDDAGGRKLESVVDKSNANAANGGSVVGHAPALGSKDVSKKAAKKASKKDPTSTELDSPSTAAPASFIPPPTTSTSPRLRSPSSTSTSTTSPSSQSFHLSTSETSRLTLSLFLSPSHILTRNPSLLPLIDTTILETSDGTFRSTTPIIKPGLTSITGLTSIHIKKGINGEKSLRIKNVKVVVEGWENVKLKVDESKDVEGKGGSFMKKSYRTVIGKTPVLEFEEYLVGGRSSRAIKFEDDTTHTYPFSISLDKKLPPSLNYHREGVSINYKLRIIVEIDKDENILRPMLGGINIVKFKIIKKEGTRLRNSSRLNSKEVEWIQENRIVYVDQKEWFYNTSPDPERKHEKGGFWRVHVVGVEGGGGVGWITGKGNVIEPVQPGLILETGGRVLVAAADVKIPLETPWQIFGFKPKTEKGMTKLRSTEGCCIPVGAGYIGLELTLNRTIFWKNDSGNREGGVGKIGPEDFRKSVDSFDGGGIGGYGVNVNEGLRRISPNELHLKNPTCTLRGVIKIKNTSKDEIPQAKVFIMREEIISVRKDRKTHRRTNICRVRTLKWGPILPHSIFTRDLAIGVNFSSHPPSLQTNNLSFKYHVLLEADVAGGGNYAKCPSTKIDFLLVEGTAPEKILDEDEGAERGRAQSGKFAAMSMTD